MNPPLLKQCVAEFVGTFALIFVGVTTIFNNNPDSGVGLLGVALAHGLTIAVMVAATAGISGGHLNPAVSLGLWLGGKMDTVKMLGYWTGQLAGATVAGLILVQLLKHTEMSGAEIVARGTPDLAEGVTAVRGIVIEAFLTFFLTFVIYGTAVDRRGPNAIAPLMIGLTIVVGILFGGPHTGAAINPARAFGPALASGHWQNHLVYWIGPMLGGAAAGLLYGRFLLREEKA